MEKLIESFLKASKEERAAVVAILAILEEVDEIKEIGNKLQESNTALTERVQQLTNEKVALVTFIQDNVKDEEKLKQIFND